MIGLFWPTKSETNTPVTSYELTIYFVRLSQEGLLSISPSIGPKRRISILKEDLITVLQNDNPSNPPDLKVFSEHTQNLVKDLGES
jgi:hypothetical protein